MSKRAQSPHRGKRDSALCKFCEAVAAPGYPVCQNHKSKLTTADRLYLDQKRAKVQQTKSGAS